MYRAVSYVGLTLALDITNEIEMTRLADDMTVHLTASNTGERLQVDGEDITDHLRGPDVERGVSVVAAISGVRAALVRQQRAIATHNPIVMVGRDIGTVVLQDATVKAYLNASVEVRARRRHAEREDAPDAQSYEDVLEDLLRRDRMDSERADSPLRPADDAMIIDTDEMEVGEVARKIVELVESICPTF